MGGKKWRTVVAVRGVCAGIYTLSSILTDRAEPSEALKATVVWSVGLEQARVLLSQDQLQAFCAGRGVRAESFSKGRRGAFFVHAAVTLPSGADHRWYVVADVEQGPAQTVDLLHAIRGGVSAQTIEQDVAAGTARLGRLAGSSDGFQKSADDLVTARHFSNTLFNIMRGGVFPHGYEFSRADFLDFVGERNLPLRAEVERAVAGLEGPLTNARSVNLIEYETGRDEAGWRTFAVPLAELDGVDPSRVAILGLWNPRDRAKQLLACEVLVTDIRFESTDDSTRRVQACSPNSSPLPTAAPQDPQRGGQNYGLASGSSSSSSSAL